MREKFNRLTKDSLVYGLGDAINKSVAIFLVPVYTRIFSTADYGVIDVLATISSMLSLSIILGFTNSQNFYFFKTDNMHDQCTTLSTSFIFRITVGILVGTIAYIFADFISMLVFKNKAYGIYLKIIALTVPLEALKTLFVNIQRLTFAKWKYLLLTVGSGLTTILFIVYLVVIKRVGLIGVFEGRLGGVMVFAVVGFFLAKDYLKISFSKSRLWEMAKYSIPLVPLTLALWVLKFSDRYFLLKFSNTSQIGLYSIGNKFALGIAMVVSAFLMAWNPFSFSVAKEDDAKQFYAKVLTYYLTGICFLSILLSLFARELLMLIAQPAYYGGSKVVGLLAFSSIAYGAHHIISIGLALTKKTSLMSLSFIIAAIANIILNYLLIPSFNIMGAACATLISFVIADIFSYFMSQKYYYINYETAKLGKIILFSGIIYLGGLGIDGLAIDNRLIL